MATIGLIGAGHIGSQIARLAVASGHKVAISNSRGPETLSRLVAEFGPNARAATVAEAAQSGDMVAVTIPLKEYRAVPVEPLAGKIVIDTNNYYPERDGHIPELNTESITTSEAVKASGSDVCVRLRLRLHEFSTGEIRAWTERIRLRHYRSNASTRKCPGRTSW